jgi:hypothetical protein
MTACCQTSPVEMGPAIAFCFATKELCIAPSILRGQRAIKVLPPLPLDRSQMELAEQHALVYKCRPRPRESWLEYLSVFYIITSRINTISASFANLDALPGSTSNLDNTPLLPRFLPAATTPQVVFSKQRRINSHDCHLVP